MNIKKEIEELSNEFKLSQKTLIALGDENRQYLILSMIEGGDCMGMRVNDIASCTNLSRPAVSHHLKILKDAGIVKMREEGTKNYYYFVADTESLDNMIRMLEHAKEIMMNLPNRKGDN